MWFKDPKNPKQSQETGLSSKHMRTLDLIMTKPHTNLKDKDVESLLKAMGFVMRSSRSSHRIWTHPGTGARFGQVGGKHHERFPDWKLKELKQAMIDRGIVPDYKGSALLGAKLPDFVAMEEAKEKEQAEDERRIGVLNLFCNESAQPPTISEKIKELKPTMSEKEIIQRLKQLEQYAIVMDGTLKAVQDLLIDLGAKVESVQREVNLIPRMPSIEAAIEQGLKSLGAVAPRTPALSPKYQAIRDAIAQNPQFKDNHKVLAALAETKASVVAEYLSKYPN